LDLENTRSQKENFRCQWSLVSPLPFVPVLTIYCTFFTNWWPEDYSYNT
jgi:hypothetical protein